MWAMHDINGWWAVAMGLVMLLFWGGVIALIIWAITRYSKHTGSPAEKTPLDIAKERYAKGEITKEQFEQLKKDLG